MDAIFEAVNEDQLFEGIDCSDQELYKMEFIACRFVSCDFTHCDLSDSDFMDCEFEKCNFSLVKLGNTGLKNARFVNSKLTGVDFSVCNDFLFSLRFEGGIIDYCSFFGKKMKKTGFSRCSIKESDFSEADLTESVFDGCDLTNSIFRYTVLEKADFRKAVNYQIDPEINKMKKARFSLFGLPGLLAKYEIFIEEEGDSLRS